MRIAFDIDGTLIDADDHPREEIVTLLRTLARCPNVTVYLWSGGGVPYAEHRQRQLGLTEITQVIAKRHGIHGGMDLAFDDQDVSLATGNIKVWGEA